jgi:tetratricopeptide (TPR) repeat protein
MTVLRLLVVVALALIASRSAAQPADEQRIAEARRQVARANELFARESYAEAARAFEAADAIAPSGVVKQNAGAAWELAGEHARAADAYEAALGTGTLDGEFTADTRRRLARLDARLGVLVVPEPRGGTMRVAHVDGRALPARIHLPPGTHEVLIASPLGKQVTRSVEVRAGAVAELRLPPETFPAATTTARAPEPSPRPEPPRGDASNAQTIVGWSVLGVGAAAGVAGAICGILFLDARGEYQRDQVSRQNPRLKDAADDWQLATTATVYPAIGAIALGVVLLVTAPESATARATRNGTLLGARW